MAGLLAGAAEGAAAAGMEYTSGIISDKLQARREERLAGIRKGEKAEERTYQKGVRKEKTAAEEETYKRREIAEEKKYQRRLTAAEKKAQIKADKKGGSTKTQTMMIPDPRDPGSEIKIAAERDPATGKWNSIKVEGLEENLAEKSLSKSEKSLAKDRIMQRRKDSGEFYWFDPGTEEVKTEAYKYRVQESLGGTTQAPVSTPSATKTPQVPAKQNLPAVKNTPPTQGARWSDKHQAWFVQKDGKWNKVE